ncbi:GntR family transcriptional regulator [Cryobacterium ruanii]|uniref:GntR family transcriptional regulator n=1 Tax=Cryobacterium ruanii TaxID=1259197 RepID=A0A4R9ALW1_9MICO|nr:GntR family transcriptional regulator [Cryobacterium ruanii]TFD64256.1 GntR family transcriptional regulator [Cryobacterium ruanii]
MALKAPAGGRKQLSEEVSDYLRETIMAGELKSGESIRADAIGELLGVSATPVREALHALKVEGFLVLAPRKGFAVAPLTGQDIRDVFCAHALIAGELASRACLSASDEQIAELGALHFELMAAAERGDNEMLEEKNHQFHRQIYVIANSIRLRQTLATFVKYVPRMFYSKIPGWPVTTANDHSAVISAFRAHDAEGAREAMSKHIINSGELLAQYFDEQQSVTSCPI